MKSTFYQKLIKIDGERKNINNILETSKKIEVK